MAGCGLELITGSVGSGKSYYAAEIILAALKEGAQVHTNLALVDSEVERRGFAPQVVKLPTDVKKMRECIRAGDEEHPNLLVLDEAAIYFYVDDQGGNDEKRNNKDVFQFLAWARRYGLEIYFLTQSDKNINVKLRRMADESTKCRNYTKVPYFAWLLVPLFGHFRRTKYVIREEKEIALFSHNRRFSSEVGSFYDTHSLMDSGIVLNKHATRRKPARNDQLVGKFIVAGLVLGVFVCLYFLTGVIRKVFFKAKSIAPAEQVVAKFSGNGQKAGPPVAPLAVFVRRWPSLEVLADDGRRYKVGASCGSSTVRDLRDYGSKILVTMADGKTQLLRVRR